MRTYTREDFETDNAWLKEFIATEETEFFILNLIKAGFSMTRKDYLDFIEIGIDNTKESIIRLKNNGFVVVSSDSLLIEKVK